MRFIYISSPSTGAFITNNNGGTQRCRRHGAGRHQRGAVARLHRELRTEGGVGQVSAGYLRIALLLSLRLSCDCVYALIAVDTRSH